jgi:hypothetical protein
LAGSCGRMLRTVRAVQVGDDIAPGDSITIPERGGLGVSALLGFSELTILDTGTVVWGRVRQGEI